MEAECRQHRTKRLLSAHTVVTLGVFNLKADLQCPRSHGPGSSAHRAPTKTPDTVLIL